MSIDLEALTPQLAELCRRYGIAELSVFGSVARGDDGPDSDVDFLYVGDPAVDATWSDRWELKEKLEALLGRKVNLVPKDYLHWVIKDRVLADARPLYAAWRPWELHAGQKRRLVPRRVRGCANGRDAVG